MNCPMSTRHVVSVENNSPMLLALDSSTEACSVALYRGGNVVEDYSLIERGHAEHLLPMIESLLSQEGVELGDMDAFAFGCGPGSFTGLRIGVAMIQGLAMSTGKPVVPVSSLAALAARHDGDVIALIDARMGQVYHGYFKVEGGNSPVLQMEETVCDPSALPVPDTDKLIVAGSGWDSYADTLSERLSGKLQFESIEGEYPHAADVVRIAAREFLHGQAREAGHALPHYVRNNVARKMGE